ncbi:MAG: Flp pilus assembly protein TadC [Caulobacteraceae bacterium]|jgi:tight adherence protein C|nr:Flp pilus assembly protein TadC [Caulobacteraceae bacterium]
MNPTAILSLGLPGEAFIEFAAAIANFVVVVMLYRAFLPNDAMNTRARAHARRRRELRAQLLSPTRSGGRTKSVVAVRGLLERLKLTRSEEGRKAAELLARAGWRTPDALTVFLGMRLAMPVGMGILVFLWVPAMFHGLPPVVHGLSALAGVTAGAFGPSVFVRNAITTRGQKIQKGLPDALDLFVICAEAGLSLEAALTRVAREIGPNSPELGDELGLTAIELGFLPNRKDALGNLAKRVDTPSVRGLVNTLAQTEKYGTPLAQALRVLAGEFRNMRMMKAEEKAARLPAILTVPMIIFILPPLFVILLGPAIIQVLAALPK